MCPDARGLNDSMSCVLLDLARYLKHGYRTYYKSYWQIIMVPGLFRQSSDSQDYYYYFTASSRHYLKIN